MAEFLKDSKLISAIEELIDKADDYLWLISPYIQLHDRIKDRLRLKKEKQNLHIIVVFGKNEADANKSLSKEDFEFLKNFPNIFIGYEKRLHAKYYASEDFSIITSMNLHQFSQNNNIEAGIKLKSNKWFSSSNDGDVNVDAYNYFLDIIDNCQEIFNKESKFKSGLLGLTSNYSHSEVIADNSEGFFRLKDDFKGTKYSIRKKRETLQDVKQGFCIRTGKPIPFNPKRPMSDEAWKTWNQFKDVNYPEKYCHYSGEPSNGETSYSKPIMRKNWNKATTI